MDKKIKCYPEDAIETISKSFPRNLMEKNVIFACIGTDRSSGDSLGPIVGSKLIKLGFKNVYGDLENPLHAVNLESVVKEFDKNKTIIAIDAALGNASSVGQLIFNKGPIKPGAGVGKELPPVGKYSISGIVNVGGFMEYFVLQNTRLHTVMTMADSIASAIHFHFRGPRKNEKLSLFRKKSTTTNPINFPLVVEKQLEY